MKGGLGDESYAKNSKPQRAILSSSVPVLAQAVLDFCDTKLPHCITIADLGCSSGPNTLFAVTRITSLIYERLFYQLSRRKNGQKTVHVFLEFQARFMGGFFHRIACILCTLELVFIGSHRYLLN
ncbi:hypothetical protein OIU78_021153 [Salix suchowensis]|nr:hypothetical protein OIU78_021153 [Salix suchowensis]